MRISKQQHHCVVAGNLSDFLSVHCFALDIKVSYILVDNDYCIKEGMDSYTQDPYKFCSQERCENISRDYAENYPDFLRYRKWMVEEMGIKPAEDPAALVADAYNSLPNLIGHIRSKDGFVAEPMY